MSGAYGLTIKQEKFAERYLEHRNATRAYKEAGYRHEGWAENSINVAAHKILNNAKVAHRIGAVLKAVVERQEYSLETAIQETREDREMARELGQLGAAVSAGKLTAQLAGHLVERKDVTHRSVAEIPTSQLEAEIEQLRDKEAHTTH